MVLRGAGAHFCAGGNLQGLLERRAAGRPVQHRMIEHVHDFITAIRAYPKPVIAAVEGAAAGAGFSLALACDLIVASAEARFVVSHGKVGLSPDGGATWLLGRSLPRALAQQLVWLAEPITAEALKGHGVVAAVTPAGSAFDEALRLAERLATMAPNALASAKELVCARPVRCNNSRHTLDRARPLPRQLVPVMSPRESRRFSTSACRVLP